MSRSTDTRDVQAELDGILAEYRALRAHAEVLENQPDEVSAWTRRLMLFRPLSFGAWLWSIGSWYPTLILRFALIDTVGDAADTVGERTITMLLESILVGTIQYFIRRSALRLHGRQIEARHEADAAAGDRAILRSQP